MVEGVGDDVFVGFSVLLLVSVFLGSLIYKFLTSLGYDPDAYFRTVEEIDSPVNEENLISDSNTHMAQRRFGDHDECPICLSTPSIPIQTNCGHLFCGECITSYWRLGNWLGAILCPVCRQKVNLLLAGWTNASSEDHQTMRRHISDYNFRFSGAPRPLLSYLWDLPTLLRHLWRAFFTDSGLLFYFRLRVVLCVLTGLIYFISPLDIVPEAIFGILGLVDDCLFLLFLVVYMTIIYRQYLLRAESNLISSRE